MKRVRSMALLLAMTMMLSCVTFVSGAYQPEVGEGYIRFDYCQVFNRVCEGKTSAVCKKNVTFQSKNTLRVTPTPEINNTTTVNLDFWEYDKIATKVELPKYKYVEIEYYYDTDKPTYDGRMRFDILPGSTAVLKGRVSVQSEQTVVAKQWAKAQFNIGKSVTANFNEETTKPWISQTHFFPYGETNPSLLKSTDVLYISSITYYEKNPDPNAKYEVSFYKTNPDAVGDNPPVILVKEEGEYTLPECPYTLSYGEFAGWESAETGEIYNPGDTLVMADYDVEFNAVWREKRVYKDYVAIDFTKYANGIVNHVNSASVYEPVVYDGKRAMKLVPNTESTTKTIALDGWSYAGAGVSFSAYKWIAIAYKYVSKAPKSVKMSLSVMPVSNKTLTKAFSKSSTSVIEEGKWAFMLFDMRGIEELFVPNVEPLLRQMHIYPLGTATAPATMLPDDELYISSILFFKEKPNIELHDAYISGYDDGNFRPNKTISRAEACTIIAKLLASESTLTEMPTFTDVNEGDWYAKYIGYCQAHGLLESYSEHFEPNKPMTRAEFTELVFKAGFANEGDSEVTFSDVSSENPRYEAIQASAAAGIINGYENGTFLPEKSITRAEAVAMINRARNHSVTNEMLTDDFTFTFLDIERSNWAFADISEAAIPHIESDEKWLSVLRDPAELLSDHYEPSYFAGNEKIAEIDALAQARKEAILSSPSDYSSVSGTSYYISNSGSDTNDGLTPETAWKTLSKAAEMPLLRGDAVLLERGGLWRERLKTKPGVTYSAYGEGDKPKIYGSPENGAVASKWTLVHEDTTTGAKIWKYANEDMLDVGAITFNDGEVYAYKEVPSYREGKFYVRTNPTEEFDITIHLDRNFEYFHQGDSDLTTAGVPNIGTAKGPIFLRCDEGNPGELFDVIEFNTRNNVISIGGANVTIDNLCVMYGGSHGIGSGTVNGLTVKNCEIGWIGGSIQTYNFRGATDGRVTRFGNGIEIYGGCDGYNVLDNYIYQNYDAGATHQHGDGTANISMYNIVYKGNLIEDCVYNIEYFHGAPSSGKARRDGKNVLFEDNILRRAGYGFGSTRPDGNCQAHIKSWASRNEFENYVIRNNIFDRSVWNLLHICAAYDAWLPKMEGNIYIQGYKNKFVLFGRESGLQYDNNLKAKVTMNNVLKDSTGEHYFVDPIPYYVFPFGE